MSRINDYIISKRDKGIPNNSKQLPAKVVAKQIQKIIMVQDQINEKVKHHVFKNVNKTDM